MVGARRGGCVDGSAVGVQTQKAIAWARSRRRRCPDAGARLRNRPLGRRPVHGSGEAVQRDLWGSWRLWRPRAVLAWRPGADADAITTTVATATRRWVAGSVRRDPDVGSGRSSAGHTTAPSHDRAERSLQAPMGRQVMRPPVERGPPGQAAVDERPREHHRLGKAEARRQRVRVRPALTATHPRSAARGRRGSRLSVR